MDHHDSLSEAVDRGDVAPVTADAIRNQIRDYRPVFDRLAAGPNDGPDEKVIPIIDDVITDYRPVLDRLADS
ncbi:MAG: hypothetical protein AB7T37_02990 [Dehalococcoidia bacterium]